MIGIAPTEKDAAFVMGEIEKPQLETLNAAARDLEATIAGNVAEILEA